MKSPKNLIDAAIKAAGGYKWVSEVTGQSLPGTYWWRDHGFPNNTAGLIYIDMILQEIRKENRRYNKDFKINKSELLKASLEVKNESRTD